MKLQLSHRLSQYGIKDLCALTQGEHNDNLKEELYQLTLDSDRRVATNALWVFTHFSAVDNEWLYAKHDQLIDRCLNEQDATKHSPNAQSTSSSALYRRRHPYRFY